MMQQNRTSRIGPSRRTLTVEALEDRTLLNGVVYAGINVPTGQLQIVGSAVAPNQCFTIAPSPIAGMLRISGDPGTFTAINSVRYTDFVLSSITSISVTLGTGNDKVTFQGGFGIPGDVNIWYSNAADVFSFTDVTANSINLFFSNHP